jgi:L,D-peptidoglycan transpeptidase YkuD (ErfK/YbiS/YcfS/YnhG family)
MGKVLLIASLAALLLPARASACRAASGDAAQLVTVEAATQKATTAAVRLWERRGACWVAVAGPWRAHVGRAGLSAHHREGDGTSPAGTFRIGKTIYGNAPSPGIRYRYRQLVCGDWWDEDPASPTYNTFRHVRCGSKPAFRVGDPLWRQTRAYRHFAVILVNENPTVPGFGSAIFIHADLGVPTSGCISLAPPRLVTLLRWLRPGPSPVVTIGANARTDVSKPPRRFRRISSRS